MIRDSTHPSDRERLLELLADQALFGLDATEQIELDELMRQHPDVSTDEMDRIATLIELTSLDLQPDHSLPNELRDQVLSQGREFFASPSDASDEKSPNLGDRPTGSSEPIASASQTAARGNRLREWGGWLVAAACLAIATFAFSDRERSTAPTLAQLRSELTAPDVVRTDWQATEDVYALDAKGDVVWSDQQQEGYMRFVGLPKNDPTREQYQLWIFDAEQDERYPVDGGVFNITDTGETIVAVDPKIKVQKATMFAITVEKPGGVVVSTRERLPLLAKVQP